MRMRGIIAWLKRPEPVAEALPPAPALMPVKLFSSADGAGDLTHWERVWGERLRFEQGWADHDPCLGWPDAGTTQFLAWYCSQSAADPNAYPEQIADRRLRGVYLEYCCRLRLRPLDDAIVRRDIQQYGRIKLNPDEAALRFVAGLRHRTEVREVASKALDELYLGHCDAEGLTALAIDTIRNRMDALPGVHKRMQSDWSTGSRKRLTVWVITPECELADHDHEEDEIPFFEDEPLRIAA